VREVADAEAAAHARWQWIRERFLPGPCEAVRMPTSTPGWYVISLRPRGQHAAIRRAAARRGAGLIALSPWALQERGDEAARLTLQCALAAPRVLFTSPAAVRAADRLQPLRASRRDHGGWLAVGSGTAAALRRVGIGDVASPQRMDSEGLLALPQLQAIAGSRVGLVTAPGGRGVLAPALQARGAEVIRADVYERVPVALSSRALAAVRDLRQPAVLAVSSGQALQHVLAAAPADVARTLRASVVVAASERLAALARECGFARIAVAASARPADLIDAALDAID